MKFRTSILIIASVLLFSISLKGQDSSSAVEYMKELFLPFEDINNKNWQYLKAVTRGKNARKIDKKRQKLIGEIEEAKKLVRGIRTLKGDSILKPSIKEYLNLTSIVLNEDFGKIMDFEDIAEQSYDAMEAYLLAKEVANKKFGDAAEIVDAAENLFAQNNNINLIKEDDDKRTQKIKNANALLKYYNELYLVFFKPHKEEAYIVEALSRNDVLSIEQHNNGLLSITEESLALLKNKNPYKGDSGLIVATRNALNNYKQAAEDYYPKLVNYFVKKDNFEKLHAKIERMKKRDRTQEIIDEYNSAVESYNAATKDYNSLIEISNKKRSETINNYNKAIDAFFNKHN